MDTIAIIIVHYNSDQDTKECLKSINSLISPGFKIQTLVVDNGSQKPLSLHKNQLPNNCQIIRSEANLGFTGGNNLGITFAREKIEPDYFLLLNNDTLVEPNLVNILYKSAKKNPQAGLISPLIYFAKEYEFHIKSYSKSQLGKVIWYAGGSLDWRNLLAFHRGVDEVNRTQFDHQHKSDFATGCCVLIPRKIIETVGLLDKKFFLYLEDVDYSLRVEKAGFDLLFEPSAFLWHKNAGSSQGAGGDTSVYYQTRNRILLAFKHGALKTKQTATKLLLRNLLSPNRLSRKASLDFLLGRFGKQPLI